MKEEKTWKIFKDFNINDKEELQIIKQMKSVKCKVLENGLKLKEMNFYLCNCDIDQKDPICEECARVCHSGENHVLTQTYFNKQVCMCGIKRHRVDQNFSSQDYQRYKQTCYFYEFSTFSGLNIAYESVKTSKEICMFCFNFCRIYYEDNDQYFQKKIICNSSQIQSCSCSNKKHTDIKFIFQMVNDIMDTNKYYFANLTSVHLINLIFLTDKLKTNIYSSFLRYMSNLIDAIENPKYRFDTQMNYSNFFLGLKNFAEICSTARENYYFSKEASNLFKLNFVHKVMEKKFDQNNSYLWEFKSYLIKCFAKITLNTHMSSFPKIKLIDFENLSPIQRLIYTSVIKKNKIFMAEYMDDSNNNSSIIDKFLKYLNVLNVMNYTHIYGYSIMHQTCVILKKFAQFYLFSTEQILKYCQVSDEIFLKIINFRQKSKNATKNSLSEQIQENEMKTLITIIKTLILFSMAYNDQQVLENLRENKPIEDIKFFHSKNEVGKYISKSFIQILNYLRNEISNDFIDVLLNKVLFYSTQLIGLCLTNPDFYLVGLRRGLQKNLNPNLNLIDIEESSTSDKDSKKLITMLDDACIILEEKYALFFNYKCKLSEIAVVIKIMIIDIFLVIIKSDKDIQAELNLTRISFMQGFTEEKKYTTKRRSQIPFMIEEYIKEDNNLSFEKEVHFNPKEKSFIYNYNDEEAKYNMLMLKSNVIFTIAKFLKILWRNSSLLKEKTENIDADNSVINSILKLFYFFVYKNPDNAIVCLSSEMISCLSSVESKSSLKIFVFYLHCLEILKDQKFELVFSNNIVKSLGNFFISFEIYPEIYPNLNVILKIFKILLFEIPTLNHNLTVLEIKSFLYQIFKKLNTFFMNCKSILILKIIHEKKNLDIYNEEEQAAAEEENVIEEETNSEDNDDDFDSNSLSSKSSNLSKNITYSDKNENFVDLENDNGNILIKSAMSSFRKKKTNKATKILKKFSRYKKNQEIYCEEDFGFKLYAKFLCLVTDTYTESTSFEKQSFLMLILSKEEIIFILKNCNLNLKLRTEIIKFYRIMYIDVSIAKNLLNEYRFEFCNVDDLEDDLVVDEEYNFRFLERLMRITQIDILDNSEYIFFNFELKKFEYIVENQHVDSIRSMKYFYYYFEHGIILPLTIYFNKIYSFIHMKPGIEVLKLYDLVCNFLKVKKFIIQNKKYDIYTEFINKNTKKSITRKEEGNADTRLFQSVFEIEIVQNLLVDNLKYSLNAIQDLSKDILIMQGKDFQAFDYFILLEVVTKHFIPLIQKNKSRSILFQFNTKNEKEDQDYDEKLTKLGLNETPMEQYMFQLILHYEKEKQNFLDSSLIDNLGDIHLEYDASSRNLLLRYLFFISQSSHEFTQRVSENALRTILRLLQFDTGQVQEEILNIYNEKEKNINLYSLSNKFFECLIEVIFSSFNPGRLKFNNSYFTACIIIKIFKYLCEEHNIKFQKIFLKELSFDMNMINPLISEEFTRHGYVYKKIMFFDMMLLILNKILIISNWDKSHIDDINDYFYDLFSCLVQLLIEIIQGTTIENFSDLYNINNMTEKKDEIEQEKNSRKSNLTLTKELNLKVSKLKKISAISILVNTAKSILFRDNSYSPILYKVRKELTEFLLAFLEEKNCPNLLKKFLVRIVHPQKILESLGNTLKKYYLIEKTIVSVEDNEKPNNQRQIFNTLERQGTLSDNSNTSKKRSFGNIMGIKTLKNQIEEGYNTLKTLKKGKSIMEKRRSLLEEVSKKSKRKSYENAIETFNDLKMLSSYKNIRFDNIMNKHFYDKYFEDEEFSDSNEFQLVNTLFRFFKLMSVENDFKSEEANFIMEKVKEVDTKEYLKYYFEKKKGKDINSKDFKKQQLLDDKIFENYFIINFFEKITETVYIQLEDKQLSRVIFTINPKIRNLSDNTKNNFYYNINRENRYFKLFNLIESSDFFVDEIKYNYNMSKNNVIFKYLNNISYFKVSIILYIVTAATNIFLLTNFNDYSDIVKYQVPIQIIAVISFFINGFFTCIWLYTKLKLYYLIETKKYLQQNNYNVDKKLTRLESFYVFYNTIFSEQDLIMFIMNMIVFTIVWINPLYSYIYGLQLLFITNLSTSLDNITKSMKLRWRQLVATAILMFFVCYCFSVFAYFFFHEDFEFYERLDNYLMSGHLDKRCDSIEYCLLSTIILGLRAHGGIGDHLEKISFLNKRDRYISRFFYDLCFYLIIVLLMLNIVFGIIIDTYRELRIKQQKQDHDKKNVCLICGAERDDLEKISIDFDNHRLVEHNEWNYVSYMIGLMFMDVQDMNATNSYVIEKIKNKNISWFPIYVSKDENED